MANPVTMKMGNQVVGAFTDFALAGIQADMQRVSQQYANAMRKLSATRQLNTVTLAETQIHDKSQRLAFSLQQQSMKDVGAAKVSAAAAGVAGGSVQQALLGLKRSALGAQDARKRNLNANLLDQAKQRDNINLATILGEDISVIQRPNVASALLGLGATLIDTYDSNQPKGSRLIDED